MEIRIVEHEMNEWVEFIRRYYKEKREEGNIKPTMQDIMNVEQVIENYKAHFFTYLQSLKCEVRVRILS